ncbi:MAG TPA: c-type cytochrome [Thermomicrobiales bacterium]|nr:c-type cytochrome [Thermomicrobiales bacterium]
MGSEQREATVVALGLVLVATVMMVYLFNEPNRRETFEQQKIDESARRGIDHYISFCLECHGEDGLATGRRGVPLNTPQNQTDDPIAWEQREREIRLTIERGGPTIMPAWAQSEGGALNDEQITDLVNLIHLGLWDEVVTTVIDRVGAIPTRPPLPTPSGETPTDPLAAEGLALSAELGCASCHSVDGIAGIGPTWQGLYMSDVALESGETVVADDDYIRESILDPGAKIHDGFTNAMPPFEGRVTDEQIDALIAYIATLTDE